MIDEKKLIERLWKRHREVQNNDDDYSNEEAEIICGEICNIVSIIDEQPQADKWIPCEVEMPKEDYTTCWVAVSESEEDENFYYASAVYMNNEGFRTNDIEAHGKIVAWQKVQPYKKDHFGEVNKMVTNADRIRNMSVEELAELFSNTTMCLAVLGEVDCSNEKNCNNCKEVIRKWLQAEVEEGESNADTK